MASAECLICYQGQTSPSMGNFCVSAVVGLSSQLFTRKVITQFSLPALCFLCSRGPLLRRYEMSTPASLRKHPGAYACCERPNLACSWLVFKGSPITAHQDSDIYVAITAVLVSYGDEPEEHLKYKVLNHLVTTDYFTMIQFFFFFNSRDLPV